MKADTAGRSTVPDVVGDTLRRAQASIGTAGLQWRANASALRPTATADLLAVYCVVSQQPRPGTVIRVPDPVHPDVVALRARPC